MQLFLQTHLGAFGHNCKTESLLPRRRRPHNTSKVSLCSLSLVCATPRMHGVLAPPLAPATASPRAPHYSAHAQLIFVAIRNGSCQPEQLMRKVFCRDAKSSYGPLLPFAHTPLTQPSPCRDFAAERMPRPQPALAHTRRTTQLRGAARSLLSAVLFLLFAAMLI